MPETVPPIDTTTRAVLTAIADLGEATAAAIAEASGVAYSTTNKKLRLLRDAGLARAERGSDTKVRWRLTDTGRSRAGGDSSVDTTPAAAGMPAGNSSPPPATHSHKPDNGDAGAGPAPGVAAGSAGDTAGDPAAASDPTCTTGDAPVNEPATADLPTRVTGATSTSGGTVTARRAKGALYRQVIAVLQENPDSVFSVAQARRGVDAARQGTGEPAASAGAVHNALIKAVADGVVSQVGERPATFQAI